MRARILAMVSLGAALLAMSAAAQEVRYAFSGVVEQTFVYPDDSFGLSVPIGTPFHGEFSYDLATPPSYTQSTPDGEFGFYEGGAFWVTVGGITASVVPQVAVFDNAYAGYDSLGVSAQPPSSVSTTGAPFSVSGFYLGMNDPTGTSFATIALPTTIGPLFNDNRLGLIFTNGGDTFAIDGAIQTWQSISAVPEPETYVLLLAGFAAMAFSRRRPLKSK